MKLLQLYPTRIYNIHLTLLSIMFLYFNSEAKPSSEYNAKEIIMSMNNSMYQHDYQGILEANSLDKAQRFNIINDAENGQSIFHSIESMQGQHSKIVREDNKLYCYFPGDKIVHKDELKYFNKETNSSVVSLSESILGTDLELQFPVSQIEKFYSVEINKFADNVAGRDALLMKLIPNDNYRFQQNLYVDENTSLLLKYELQDNQNQILRSHQYIDISFDNIDSSLIDNYANNVNQEWKVFDHSVDEMQADSVSTVEVDNSNDIQMPQLSLTRENCFLPKDVQGFKYQKMIGRESSEALMMKQYNFSDGISTLSIFIEPLTSKFNDLSDGFISKGTINSYYKKLSQDILIMMGEVPEPLISEFVNNLDCK